MEIAEIPSPTGLAPYSAALQLTSTSQAQNEAISTSTFVLLFDPTQEDIWGEPFRLVGHLRSQIDTQMGEDPILNELMWSDLQSSLDQYAPGATSVVGTVTKELSQAFGGLELNKCELHVNLRCSWTPGTAPNVGLDLQAWCHLMLATVGMHHELPLGLEVSEG